MNEILFMLMPRSRDSSIQTECTYPRVHKSHKKPTTLSYSTAFAFLNVAVILCFNFEEALNVKKVNSPRYSGLVQKKALSVVPVKDGKGVVLIYKKAKSKQILY